MTSTRDKVFVVLCLLAAVLVWAMLTLPYGYTQQSTDDTSVYSYVAQRLLAGDVLYRDVWDHKGPVIYIIDMLGLWLGGGSYGGIKAVEFVLLASVSVLLYLSLKEAAGGILAALIALAVAIAMRKPLGQGNFTEGYAVFFQAWALACVVRLQYPACYWHRFGLLCQIGIVGALAFFLRANLVGFWLVLGLYWLTDAIARRDARAFLRDSFKAGGAFVLVSGAFVGYFALRGVLPDFLDAFLFQNIRHSQSVELSLVQKLGKMFATGLVQYPFLPVSAIGAALLVIDYARSRAGRIVLFVPCWLIVEILVASLSGRQYPHYVLPWVIPAAGLAAFAVYRIAMGLTRSQMLPSGVCTALLAVAAVGMLASTVPAFQQALELWANRHNTIELTEYVKANSRPDQTVFFYEGFDSHGRFLAAKSITTLFFAERKLPTPYVWSTFFLEGDEALQTKMKETLYNNWVKSPPALVVITGLEDSMYFQMDTRIAVLVYTNYHPVAKYEFFTVFKPNVPGEK
jgi:hypothetical protein